jgi:hypothetical protein
MGEVSGFMLSGGLNFIWIAVIWGGNIVEPSVNEDKEAKRRNKKSFWGQVRS